ncbi:hypothetical protein GCM10009527_044400 [Actinomadura nitritigenes]
MRHALPVPRGDAWIVPPWGTARGARRPVRGHRDGAPRGAAASGGRRVTSASGGRLGGDKVPKPQQKANPPKINNGPGQPWSVAVGGSERARAGPVSHDRQGRPAPYQFDV